MSDEGDITLRVKDDTGEMSFEIRADTSLKQLMDTYCAKTGRSRKGLGFLVNGAPCSAMETPASLGLADGDVIDVVPA